jgi:hypothetical protein
MMMGSSSSLPLFIVPHTAPPAPSKSKRDWKDDSTALLMDLSEEKFLANSMKTLIDPAAVARNFIEDGGGISIDPSAHLGSSPVQST